MTARLHRASSSRWRRPRPRSERCGPSKCVPRALRVDHAAYIEQVKALATLLPDGQLDEADLAGATALLAKRLSDAVEGERARSDLARRLEERDAALTQAEEAQTSAAAALEAFLAESGVEDTESLRIEVERAAQATTSTSGSRLPPRR